MFLLSGMRAGLVGCVLSCLAFAPRIAIGQSEDLLPQAPERSAQQQAQPEPATADDGGLLFDPVGPFPDVAQAFAPGREEEMSEAMAARFPLLSNSDIPDLQGGHLQLNSLLTAMDRSGVVVRYDPNAPVTERYHLKGLLLESLAFQSEENVFRFITDKNMRHLTADKPFWHDYISSLKQWNMRRWWDGDDVLVDYVGHPIQGSVSSFIEIQNSPRQRLARFGDGREYWRGRFLAMLWSAVYSAQQKVGPMGEAALGSDGGITYPLNCSYPCKNYKPGDPYTNNTGWTDFIATPVIGTVWVVLEDFLDKNISDRVQHGDMNAVFPKILRGALNPSRTMANALRWRKPWYRDFQQVVPQPRVQIPEHFFPNAELVAQLPRYELFPHYNSISLPVTTETCGRCRRWVGGPGVGASVRINKWVDFDTDVNYGANASPLPSARAGGNMVSGTFGFRTGFENTRYALKFAIRPGFVSYDRAWESSQSATNPTPNIGRITHMAAALAFNGDYAVARHIAIRGVIGNTPVRYRTDRLDAPTPGKPPYLSWLSRNEFRTNENWDYQTGVVARF